MQDRSFGVDYIFYLSSIISSTFSSLFSLSFVGKNLHKPMIQKHFPCTCAPSVKLAWIDKKYKKCGVNCVNGNICVSLF